MRLRNVPGADAYLTAHPLVIKNETRYRGTWKETFQNPENPIHIEIGMGKGQFLLTLAKENPSINYIGIERYSSVLLRALERFDNDEEYKDVNNIRFICMDATNLPEVFAVGEIDKIYLNFSDPWVLLAKTYDLHNDPTLSRGNVMTEYEEKFSGQGHPIHKLIAMRQ